MLVLGRVSKTTDNERLFNRGNCWQIWVGLRCPNVCRRAAPYTFEGGKKKRNLPRNLNNNKSSGISGIAINVLCCWSVRFKNILAMVIRSFQLSCHDTHTQPLHVNTKKVFKSWRYNQGTEIDVAASRLTVQPIPWDPNMLMHAGKT